MINKNHMYTFIGFLRLYKSSNYSIIATLDNYKVKYTILDSHDKEITGIYGVDWYDLLDVMKTMQLLECEALDRKYIDTDMVDVNNKRYVDVSMFKRKLNEMYGRGEENV